MADRFGSYDDLSITMTEGQDYRVISAAENRNPNIAVIAPHGGKIEHGTSEIAKATAAETYRLYSFEGTMEKNNFHCLHITSHRFSEPRCLDLIASSEVVLAIHGRKDGRDAETTGVGGLDASLIGAIIRNLTAAGFAAAKDAKFPATNPFNICNRGRTGQGAQIEIPHTLRRRLEKDKDTRMRFTEALRSSIDELSQTQTG